MNQWTAFLHNYQTGPRKEMLYNIDPGKAGTDLINAGIRYKEMKLLVGDPGKPDGWRVFYWTKNEDLEQCAHVVVHSI